VTDTFIRAVATEVKGHDGEYEKALKELEKNNPKYNFLLKRDVRKKFLPITLLAEVTIASPTCILPRPCRVTGAFQAGV